MVTASLLVLLAVVSYLVAPRPPARYQPSEYAALVPEIGSNFPDYVAESRTRIRQALRDYYFREGQTPFRGSYTLDEVARMRAPFEYQPSSNCDPSSDEAHLGILMLHGLTDSPYLLRPVASSLAFRFPCALIRGLLTPGHGTVPGDLLNTDLEEWRQVVDFGVASFSDSVERLVVLGYSNGAALSLDYLNRNPDQQLVDQLVLIAPALQPADQRAWMAPWLKWLMPWINEYPDEDAVKYESFPTHAAGEFYHLTQSVRAQTQTPIQKPSLTLVSAADTTVSSQASLNYFCQWLANDQSRLLWFDTEQHMDQPDNCDSIEAITLDDESGRFLSPSHVSLTMPANDPHYGVDGAYPACLTYFDSPARYQQCMTDSEATVYGENSLLDAQRRVNGKLLRRSTFNPAYDQMIDAMACFIGQSC